MREFNLHIIEADDDFYNGKCVSLVVPTTEGMIGILAMHENLVAAVTIGVIKYTLPDGTRCHAAVSNGLLKVENNEVLILVESCEDPSEIDVERAKREEQMAKEALADRSNRLNYRAAKGMLKRAVNRLKIQKRYGKYN